MRDLPLRLLLAAFAAVAMLLPTSPASAQSSDAAGGWNSPRALDLVQRAQRSRQLQQVDTAMLNYRADGRGFVYFLLDHPESGQQSLVRTDQVAVEVYWQAPDQVRQHIVGLRERKELPVSRLYYYLDRMTVVQDNYGDGIMIADGENVNNVPHPAAPGSETIYEYQLADSLTLRLPGADAPVRVFELRVRPLDAAEPAVVGSLFVDAGSGAVVRMDFTFTRAAYVDRRLDYINVSLENGLWKGRFWLPHEQRLEIRREVPELDFPVGTIIRTRMRVGDYRFNEELPRSLFYGRPITIAPREQREAFGFEQPIDAERRLEGIGRPLEVAEVRREARRLLRQQAMSGLPRSRFHLNAASDLFRYNRAEGAVLGLGGSFVPAADATLRVHGGWAFGASHPLARAELLFPRSRGTWTLSAYANQPRDVGIVPAASGVLNTLSALVAGEDYTDLYAASGASLSVQRDLGQRWVTDLGLRVERHSSLEQTATTSLFGEERFRGVRPITDGTFGGAGFGIRRVAPAGTDWVWRTELGTDVGALSIGDAIGVFTQPRVAAGLERNWTWRDSRLEFDGSAGMTVGEIGAQSLFLLGGRGTVAGYGFRTFGGDRFALGSATLSTELYRPWLRGRVFTQAGWTGVSATNRSVPAAWGTRSTDGVITSAGAGVGIFYDLLHVNLARGLNAGGRWELSVEALRAFWDWL